MINWPFIDDYLLFVYTVECERMEKAKFYRTKILATSWKSFSIYEEAIGTIYEQHQPFEILVLECEEFTRKCYE